MRGKGHDAGLDRLAARRLLGELRDIHVAIDGQRQGARNRRRRHHQQVGDAARLGLKRQPLMHAEAVLLVDDHEAQVVEGDVLLEQRMGADENVDLARRQRVRGSSSRGCALLAPGQQRDAHAGGLAASFDSVASAGAPGFRSAPSAPPARRSRPPRQGQQRDHGLARADIALQQPQHPLGRGHVAQDVVHGVGLRIGEAVGQGREDLRADCPVAAQRAALRRASDWRGPARGQAGSPATRHRQGGGGRGLGTKGGGGLGMVQGAAVQRRRQARRGAGGRQRPAIPAEPASCSIAGTDGLGQDLSRKAFGQGIDRLDERQPVELLGRDDVIRDGPSAARR